MQHPSRRRFFQGSLALAGLSLVPGCGGWSLPWQQTARIPRIGFLSSGAPPPGPQHQAFLQGLGELGYVDGHTLAIEFRWAEEQPERLPALVRDLVSAQVDVMLMAGGDAAVAAKQTSATTPIVFAAVSDPIRLGLVESLGRPGGNATGLSLVAPALDTKRVELLNATVPDLVHLAVLADARGVNVEQDWEETRVAAGALGVDARRYDVRSPDDFEAAFSAMTQHGAQALVVLVSPFFNRHRAILVNLATRAALPAVYELRIFAEVGGLLSYGPNLNDLYRRAATYVDKILKGTKPAELPVEQPTRFDAVINLTTAQALDLTIPESVLQQATELIQ